MRKTFEFKVVVCGPFGVGKTTFIRNISGEPVVGTEVPTTGVEALHKGSTTVGLEYGTFETKSSKADIRLLLYGTPGQERFRFMWDVVAVGADICLVLGDATRPDSWDETFDILGFFSRKTSVPVCAVGLNRAHEAPGRAAQFEERAADHPEFANVSLLRCDVGKQIPARRLLLSLLELLAEATLGPPPVLVPVGMEST